MKYNESQTIALNHNKGPMLVIAGPGSGKTAVITGRTLNLCEQMGVNPVNILVITFTKAAANQMKSRFESLSNGNYSYVSFGTFHSVFFTILKSVYNYQSSNILKEEHRYQIIKGLMDKYNIEYEDEKEMVGQLASEISLVKGEMMSLQAYCSVNTSAELFRKIFTEYNETLCNNRLIDFDDMLIRCYHLLKSNKEALKVWQERFKYILVDEFQDINLVQYLVVKMLAAPENNLFIVGDDDQSIYSFRGAKPEIMLNFEKDYPGCKKVVLDVNYRSTQEIVTAASRVISNNTKRFDKRIRTATRASAPINIKEFANVYNQNEYVAKQILGQIKKVKLNDIAILFRTNTQARGIAAKLMEYNIPFTLRERIPEIYDHFIAKDLFTYVSCSKQLQKDRSKAKGSIDRGDFLRIMNKPNRYISKDSLLSSKISLDEMCNYYKDKGWMVDRMCDLFGDVELLAGMPPFAAVTFIRSKIGYDSYINEYAKLRKISLDELMSVLEEITLEAKAFDTFEQWEKHIAHFRENMEKQYEKGNREGVVLMTFHSSKGLEFEKVYIIDVNETITPHEKSKTNEAVEEERRMFYVAMTRAKKELNILYSIDRYNKQLRPSRFLGEIYVSKKELTNGREIEHKVYGKGRIIENDGEKIKVVFEKGSIVKVFNIDFCVASRIISI